MELGVGSTSEFRGSLTAGIKRQISSAKKRDKKEIEVKKPM